MIHSPAPLRQAIPISALVRLPLEISVVNSRHGGLRSLKLRVGVLVAHAGPGIGPGDRLALSGKFERMAHAAAIAAVEVGADVGADQRAERRPDDDGDRTINVLAHAGGDRSAAAAEKRAHGGGITGAGKDAIVAFPLLAGVAHVHGIAQLAGACAGPGGLRVRRHLGGHQCEENEREKRKVERVHVLSSARNGAAAARFAAVQEKI
jgi:hypothetical protein